MSSKEPIRLQVSKQSQHSKQSSKSPKVKHFQESKFAKMQPQNSNQSQNLQNSSVSHEKSDKDTKREKENPETKSDKFTSGALGISLFAANSDQLANLILKGNYESTMDLFIFAMVALSLILQVLSMAVSTYLNGTKLKPENKKKLACLYHFNAFFCGTITLVNITITSFSQAKELQNLKDAAKKYQAIQGTILPE